LVFGLIFMDEGYILSNKYRKTIFDSIIAGDNNINFIVKKHRIVKRIADKIVKDLEENGLIKVDGNVVEFTEEGEKLAEKI
jgi:predicted methyltransferase